MHSQDIVYQVAHRDLAAIKLAFRAIVTGHDTIEGINGPESAADLLRKLASALKTDEHALPRDLADSIAVRAPGGSAARTYADGARAVLAAMPRFTAMLAANYPEPIQGE